MSEDLTTNTGNEHEAGEYDEAFILRAVAISHVRSRSVSEVAALLSIPAVILEKWRRDYADRVEVRYLEDVFSKSKHVGLPYFAKWKKTTVKEKIKRCPKCGSDVVFEPVKSIEVQRGEGVDIGTHDDIMNSGDDAIFGIEVPYVRVRTERIARCPACGLYTIQNVTEKLTQSGV